MTSIYMDRYGLCKRKMACVRSLDPGHFSLCTKKVFGNTGKPTDHVIDEQISNHVKAHKT